MLLTCSGRDSRRHADNLTRNIDNSGHSRPARTFTKSPKTAKVEFDDRLAGGGERGFGQA